MSKFIYFRNPGKPQCGGSIEYNQPVIEQLLKKIVFWTISQFQSITYFKVT